MKSTLSVTAPLGLMSLLAISAGVLSADAADRRVNMIRPGAGHSFEVGRSHVMTYFVADQGACNLTMVVGEAPGEEQMPTSAGTRFNTSIPGGRRARIDTAEGKSVEFTCAPGATMMSLRRLDTLAYSAPVTN